jgi:hypothetical protein
MKYIYAALAGVTFTAPSFAKNITAEADLSTLGFYAAPVDEMNENIYILVTLYFGSQNYNSTEGGTKINGKLTSKSAGIVFDFYLSGSGFRIGCGLTAGGYNFGASTASLELHGKHTPAILTSISNRKKTSFPSSRSVMFAQSDHHVGRFSQRRMPALLN